MGLSYIKQKVVEDAPDRKALYKRFMESQKYVQKDPWAERASNRVAEYEFAPLKQVGSSHG